MGRSKEWQATGGPERYRSGRHKEEEGGEAERWLDGRNPECSGTERSKRIVDG
jgi:hypothetical protein